MAWFTKISEGWKLFQDSVDFLIERPVFFVPIFFSWVVVAIVTLYSRYFFPPLKTVGTVISYIYFLIVIMTFSVCMANLVMLELMQQIEQGKKTSLLKALIEAIGLDMVKVIPISLIWGVAWLIIVILRSIKKKFTGQRAEPSIKDSAKTLSGMNSPFSFVGLGLDMLEKLVRMIVFMALPAIAWENRGPTGAFVKAFKIIKKHPVQFLTSYSLTLLAAAVMALPLLGIYVLDKVGVELSSTVWLLVIIYSGIVWTFEVYMEQMSVGMLYLWHLKWEKKGGKGNLSSVKRPSLLDNVHELK